MRTHVLEQNSDYQSKLTQITHSGTPLELHVELNCLNFRFPAIIFAGPTV